MSDSLFRYTSGPTDAKVMIVGEAWGEAEANRLKPFVGMSGNELTTILSEAGIARNEVLLTNLVDSQPQDNNMWSFFYPTKKAREEGHQEIRGLYPMPIVRQGLIKLYEQIKAHPRRLIIGLGNYSLWALTNNSFSIAYEMGRKVPRGIGRWRGSQLKTHAETGAVAFLPTYHPAAVLRQWPWRYLLVHDLKGKVPHALEGGVWDNEPPYQFILRPSYQAVTKYLRDILTNLKLGPTQISVDLETRNGHIACIGLATSRANALCIPLMCMENDAGYWTIAEEMGIHDGLRNIFMHENALLIGQNFTYDLQYIEKFLACKPKCYVDTMVAHHLCWPGTPRDLGYLSSLYCDYHSYWKDEGKDWDPKVPEEQLWAYNCKDAVTTFEIAQVLLELIKAMKLDQQWIWQMQQWHMVVNMMLRGVKIDLERRAKAHKDVEKAIKYREIWLEEAISERVWPRLPKAKPWYRSPKQQMQIFYEELGLREIKNRKTGRPTVDDEALAKIATRQPFLQPIIQMLLELRSLGVFSNTFLSAELDPDGRMRSTFDIAGTVTFRWASKANAWGRGTNFMNIPKGTEDE